MRRSPWRSWGCAYRKLGRPGEGLGHLQPSLAIFRELGSRAPTAGALSELGETYLSPGRAAEARTGIASLEDQ